MDTAEPSTIDYYNMPPPSYNDAVTMNPVVYAYYLPPPNYHEVIAGYINTRPTLVGAMENQFNPNPNAPRNTPNSFRFDTDYGYDGDMDKNSVIFNGHEYFDLSAIFVLVIYNLPLYVIGPFIYSGLFDHIAKVLIGGSIGFPNGLESEDKYIALSYGTLIVCFQIIKSIVYFLFGRFSYLKAFSSKLHLTVNMSVGMSLVIFFLNISMLRMSYVLIGLCTGFKIGFISGYLVDLEYAMILFVYLFMCVHCAQSMFKFVSRWDGVYYRTTEFFSDSTLYQIRVYILFSLFLCILWLLGCSTLIYDVALNIVQLLGSLQNKHRV
ncbi:uncharacterized protein NESG_01245 [Nematocida ausubeli]|uniref:Uncharacterized protein n=1 Tax=Nematocida ausubeli (strain ATCC PRA-371 / ERTm2) TaxID=1913371 RepID=H8ZBF3_NEMA1|nr:uncharacterized protein NESG_01245 [Nematocida ausubeli]EHY66206.1 hypothetical protein NERG_00902 [Nematocida ausubeli]KFG26130.1 hypothetical protein NESG_01245 [Nematocida ausubeli]